MFFDSSSDGGSEQIGLAYSLDGIMWKRYGDAPVVIPPGGATPSGPWDADYAFRPSVFKLNGIYHMYYCGSNSQIDHDTTLFWAHGIGHATSDNGIDLEA